MRLDSLIVTVVQEGIEVSFAPKQVGDSSSLSIRMALDQPSLNRRLDCNRVVPFEAVRRDNSRTLLLILEEMLREVLLARDLGYQEVDR